MENLAVVLSTSMVRSRNVNLSGRVKKIHLTPWDLFLLRFGYIQRGLLFPKPSPKTDLVSRLKTSLSIALDQFYPFSGQLVKVENDDKTASFFIDCDSGPGVKFVHATAENISLTDVLGHSGSAGMFFGSFFPAYGVKNYQGVSNPLLMVQVTEMKDGVFISVGYNHTVADDTSIWMFFKAWSEICSKESETFRPLLLPKGWFFDGIDYPIRIQDPETEAPKDVNSRPDVLQETVFHLTKENVLKLKAKANEETGNADGKLSSLQAVLGHIWRSMVRHSGKNFEEETHCQVPANMRHRLSPPLAEECFGNMSPAGIATTTVRELLDHGLGWAAVLINKMVESRTNEKVKEFAENWVRNVKTPVDFGSSTLVVTSSHRFDVYCNDFGWGKPIAARAGPANLNGRLVLFKGFDEGSLDLQACLPFEVVVNLLKDCDFLEYVNIA